MTVKDNTTLFTPHQVKAYQKKIKALEEKIETLITVGKENERIWEVTCQLTEGLLKNETEANFLEEAEQALSHSLHLPFIAIRLLNKHARSSRIAIPEQFILNCEEEKKLQSSWEEPLSPWCGGVEVFPFQSLFSSLSFSEGSCAIVPLSSDERGLLGILILGSREREKFFPDMGTVFLTFLGRVMSYWIGLRLRK